MAICRNCGRRNRIDALRCDQCGWPLDNAATLIADDPIIPPLSTRGGGGHWEPCPAKCHEGLIKHDRCGGIGLVRGPWHEETCEPCRGTGKVKCDYRDPRTGHVCKFGRIWVD